MWAFQGRWQLSHLPPAGTKLTPLLLIRLGVIALLVAVAGAVPAFFGTERLPEYGRLLQQQTGNMVVLLDVEEKTATEPDLGAMIDDMKAELNSLSRDASSGKMGNKMLGEANVSSSPGKMVTAMKPANESNPHNRTGGISEPKEHSTKQQPKWSSAMKPADASNPHNKTGGISEPREHSTKTPPEATELKTELAETKAPVVHELKASAFGTPVLVGVQNPELGEVVDLGSVDAADDDAAKE